MQQNLRRYFATHGQGSSQKRRERDEDNEVETSPKYNKQASTLAGKLRKFARLSPVLSTTEVTGTDSCSNEEDMDFSVTLSHTIVQNTSQMASSDDPSSIPQETDNHFASQKVQEKHSTNLSPGPSCQKIQYTPLEQQYISIRSQYKDAVLLVECGYKYRFFGEDAKIAAKVLNIVYHMDHNFLTASIPVHRLFVHVQRLVATGYKVGVVNQTETAALKATSDKKSGPFSRELSALYTKTTFQVHNSVAVEHGVEEEDNLYMMCVCSSECKDKKSVTIGILAVQPLVGNMIYDEFTDSITSLSQLEMRLSHINPAEIVYSAGVIKFIDEYLVNWKKQSDSVVRLEELPQDWCKSTNAIQIVSNFYTQGKENTAFNSKILQSILELPSLVISCLSGLIKHLTQFKLQNIFLPTENIRPFSSGGLYLHMGSHTLYNLEIFQNQTNRSDRGSLFWVLNHTSTQFGHRLLKQWLSHPLTDIKKIKERQEAVCQLLNDSNDSVSVLSSLLSKLPDLEKLLCACYQYKCKPPSFVLLIKALQSIEHQLSSVVDMAAKEIHSFLLLKIFSETPSCLSSVDQFLIAIDEVAAKQSCYENLFTNQDMFPEIIEEKEIIKMIEDGLQKYKETIRKLILNFNDYVTISGTKYLVEVKNTSLNKVPKEWTRINSTKTVTRFHPPYITESLLKLAQHRDQLKIKSEHAWQVFLQDFNVQYGSFKKAVNLLAIADCLLSLAQVAKLPGYNCPFIVEEKVLQITGGRNPIVDLLLNEEQYVPNDTDLSALGTRTMIITGPNMGGKSSYIRQVALLCIMAQVGSYIPVKSAKCGILDAIYTRMGASDDILSGCSTYMTELTETSEIIHNATSNSLVVIDELGRGTSTHDGTAIAYATLIYFIEQVQCFTLFVTHYPCLSQLEYKYPETVGNFHMSYIKDTNCSDAYKRVVFLYEMVQGRASGSYGLNVAALAGIPVEILSLARDKSKELQLGIWQSLSSTSSSQCTFHELMNTSDNDTQTVVKIIDNINI